MTSQEFGHIDPSFFSGNSPEIGVLLLGKSLVYECSGAKLSRRIHEVEVYDGLSDLASHASRGKTDRNQIMYGPPGIFYCYLCYGVHWMLNIVTREEGYPAAILIRGAGLQFGPGKLTKNLGIQKNHNGLRAHPQSGLYFADDGYIPASKWIKKTPRIGVDYAGPVWAAKKWRYVIEQKNFAKADFIPE